MKLEFNYYSGWVGGWIQQNKQAGAELGQAQLQLQLQLQFEDGFALISFGSVHPPTHHPAGLVVELRLELKFQPKL